LVNSNGTDSNGIDDILVDMLDKVPSGNEMEQQGPGKSVCCVPSAEAIEKIASFPHRLLQAHSSFVESRIATQRITLRQFEVLNAALLLGSPSQRDLTDYTGIDRSTLSDIINRLTSNGLTQKDQSPDDRRAQIISLTKEGDRILNQIAPLVVQANLDFFGFLSEDEFETLIRMHSKLPGLDGSEQRIVRPSAHSIQDTQESGSSDASPINSNSSLDEEAALLKRLQRARNALEVGLITETEFDAEKKRYLDGTPG
tara:strand:- start:12594 stop:13361 length:768 start_codon:yes stop_codon:yes gene_type:complete